MISFGLGRSTKCRGELQLAISRKDLDNLKF